MSLARAFSASPIIDRKSKPKLIRNSPSAAVAQRVCRTDFSSANGITISSVVLAEIGEFVIAVITTVGSVILEVASTTSVVVPDRERAITRSYFRLKLYSLATHTSVSPWPSDSRSAA